MAGRDCQTYMYFLQFIKTYTILKPDRLLHYTGYNSLISRYEFSMSELHLVCFLSCFVFGSWGGGAGVYVHKHSVRRISKNELSFDLEKKTTEYSKNHSPRMTHTKHDTI